MTTPALQPVGIPVDAAHVGPSEAPVPLRASAPPISPLRAYFLAIKPHGISAADWFEFVGLDERKEDRTPASSSPSCASGSPPSGAQLRSEDLPILGAPLAFGAPGRASVNP